MSIEISSIVGLTWILAVVSEHGIVIDGMGAAEVVDHRELKHTAWKVWCLG